jgi:hypothetical protein
MKTLISTCVLILSIPAYSQLGNTLFGLARTSNPPAVYVASMDPSTGIATNMSQTSVSSSINLTGAALNPYSNEFCFIGDNGLKSINLTSGQLSNTATINNPNGAGYFDLFRFNTSDSLMYGLARRNITNPQTGSLTPSMYLATIDAITGTISEISPSSIGQGFAYAGSAIDPHQMVFYYSNGAQLVGLDMYNGSIFSNPTLTFPNGGQHFDNFTYSCADTSLYGLVRTNYFSQFYDPQTMVTTQVLDSATIHLGKVDAMTGVVTKISTQSLGVSAYSVNGSSTIDPVNMIYYFISGGSAGGLAIYGVSLQSGLVVSQGVISNANALYFDMMRIQSDCYESRPTRLNPNSAGTNETTFTSIQTFPNPCGDELHITSEETMQSYELFNSNGMLAQSGFMEGREEMIAMNRLPKGVYHLTIHTTSGITTHKIIK